MPIDYADLRAAALLQLFNWLRPAKPTTEEEELARESQ